MKSNNQIIFFAIFFIFCFRAEQLRTQTDCKNVLIDSVAIVRCIQITDGDTWKFQLKNDIFSVRVLGIDCFETRHGKRLTKQAEQLGITIDSALNLGKRTKYIADSLLTGKDITIIRDFKEPNFDVYGRLLRHCFIDSMFNYANYLKTQGLTINEK